MGKKSAFPSGTSQGRTAVPDVLKTPVKNQTSPDWPFVPFLQVVSSKNGFLSTGSEYAHCHHFALHSPYVKPNGRESGGKTPGLELCASAGAEIGDRSSTAIMKLAI